MLPPLCAHRIPSLYPKVQYFPSLPLPQPPSPRSPIPHFILDLKPPAWEAENEGRKYSFINVNRYSSKCKTIRVRSAKQFVIVYLFWISGAHVKKYPGANEENHGQGPSHMRMR